jgi:hypothetical protein
MLRSSKLPANGAANYCNWMSANINRIPTGELMFVIQFNQKNLKEV